MYNITYIVNSVFTSRTYIISKVSSNDIWLIDCGDFEKIREIINVDSVVKGVFFTHIHYDHIYGLRDIIKSFPECGFYTNSFGLIAFNDEKINMSKYHNDPINYSGDNIIVISEGCVIDLYDNLQIRVFETPGHHPSCISYIMDRYIFTGDSYIPGFKVVTNLPRGDKITAEKSKQKILELSNDKIIMPGHEV